MLYRFKSKATGDLIMLEPNGAQLLQLLGREAAPTGIFEVADMPAILQQIQASIEAAEQARQEDEHAELPAGNAPGRATEVSLRQRLWPMVEMLQRAHRASEPVVWGA